MLAMLKELLKVPVTDRSVGLPFDFDALVAPFSRPDGTVLGPFNPPHFGFVQPDDAPLRAEVGFLLRSIIDAGDRFRFLVLGSAPGEWAVRAQRAYQLCHPQGDFMSINIEGDLGHIEMMRQFFEDNNGDTKRNAIIFGAVAQQNGWAYFPIINSAIDWGAGIASISTEMGALESNISMTDRAINDRINTNYGKPLQFRTVMALSLEFLLSTIGEVDYVHCDIQGSEIDVFPAQMKPMNEFVRCCCIATHGANVELSLLEVFEKEGWMLEARIPGHFGDTGGHDGAFVWTNPRLYRPK